MKITLNKSVKIGGKFEFGDVEVDAKIGKKLVDGGHAVESEQEEKTNFDSDYAEAQAVVFAQSMTDKDLDGMVDRVDIQLKKDGELNEKTQDAIISWIEAQD